MASRHAVGFSRCDVLIERLQLRAVLVLATFVCVDVELQRFNLTVRQVIVYSQFRHSNPVHRVPIAPILASVFIACPAKNGLADDDAEFFEKRMQLRLVERCESCHSIVKGNTHGNLGLDTRDGWKKVSDRGAAVVSVTSDESLLMLTYRYGGRDYRLTDEYAHVAKEILV